uniref:Uncharacterized protein n=1 Tax=Haptolina ericina TaxID=156174 RepID=A0A7S3BN92_9EUKA|mmetsp:Transcript_62121/g.138398  ORF Transcript_62121/g.138398 Transcript_62121/m.138398 type:complete len:128 (+) Transcript_62121:3-386(+)
MFSNVVMLMLLAQGGVMSIRLPVAALVHHAAHEQSRVAIHSLRMAEDEPPGSDLTPEEAAKVDAALKFEAGYKQAIEKSAAARQASYGSWTTKAASVLFIVGAFSLGISALDPNVCSLLAPIKPGCL